MYACDDSCVGGLIENDICDVIDSLSPNSSNFFLLLHMLSILH